MRFFVAFLLFVSLVVPQAVWAAHAAGHDEVVSANEVHSHGHDHSAANHDDDAHEGTLDDSSPVHSHAPAELIASAALLADVVFAETPVFALPIEAQPSLGGAPQESLHFLLRPPRAA